MTPRSSRARIPPSVPQDSVPSEIMEREAAGENRPTPTEVAPRQDQTVRTDGRTKAIREAAYRRFEARGRVHGRDLEDWLEAEAEVESSRDKP